MPFHVRLLSFVTKPHEILKFKTLFPTTIIRNRVKESQVMSIEARMKAVIESRSGNFYSFLDDFDTSDAIYTDDPTSPYYGYSVSEIFAAINDGETVPQTIIDWASDNSESKFEKPADPDFDFIEKYDADGNPVFTDPDKAKAYQLRMAHFNAVRQTIDSNSNIYYTEDESSEFFGYTYDEIIGMANNGVTIPDEILDWAYSMADANAVEMTTETEGASAHDLYISLKNNPLLNIKTITKIFVNKCQDQTQEIEAYLDEINPIEKEMEAARVDAETEKDKSLNNIKSLVKEWKYLQAKFESGEALSDADQQRFEELKGLFGEEDEKYQDTIDNTTRNFTNIRTKLSMVTGKAETAFDFGSETILISQELAEFEKTSKNRSVFGGLVNSGIIGVLSSVDLSGSKRFSETAHTVGMNTQYFADDVNTTIQEVQLLMQDTADTAGFDLEDPSYTVEPLTSDEGIVDPTFTVNTKSKQSTTPTETSSLDNEAVTVEPPQAETEAAPAETNPENIDGSGAAETSEEGATDATEEGEQTDEEMMSDGESSLEEVDAKTLALPKLKRLIQDEGVDSEKKGKDALKLVEQLKAQSTVVEEKEEQVQEDTAEVKEASESEPEEGTQGTDNEGEMEEAQTTAAASQGDLESASEEESLTVQGLRETFQASTKANKKYSKDVDYANKEMKSSMYSGAFTIAGGGYMTGVGIYNVVQGTALLSAAGWWNPFITAIATYMINMGTMEIGLGSTMIASGTALTVSATEGMEINEEAGEKIGVSGEDITTATESLDQIEQEQTQGVEGEENKTENAEEEENTEEPDEDDARKKDQTLLGKMYTGNEELPPQRSLVAADGKKSSAMGKENVSKLTTLERQIPSLIESTIEMEQAKQEQAAQSADPESTGSATNVQDPAEVYEEYRQDYNADLATNKTYQKDIKETNENAKLNLGYAATGTAAGTARTALGASEIALGTILAAQWWNPAAMMLGIALIKKGTEDTALGTEMLTVGLALTVNSTVTLAAGAIASAQVSESNDKTNESLETVNTIEDEINTAVQEQLAANGEQDLSGMSVIELLTLIINNGIQSSVLGTENTEILETLKSQLPQLIEKAGTSEATTAEEPAETTGENSETAEPETEEADGQQNKEGEKDSPLAQYKNDFKADLATNERYSTEIRQARGMSPILKTSFFLGAPVEKASAKIEVSNEQTNTALDEVEKMETEIEKAEEEKRQAQEEGDVTGTPTPEAATTEQEDDENVPETEGETEYEDEGVYVPEYTNFKVRLGRLVEYEDGDPEIEQDKDAEDETKDAEKDEKKLEQKGVKEEKKAKTKKKEGANLSKEIEEAGKQIEETDKILEEQQTLAEEQGTEGEEAQQSSIPPEDAESAAAEAQTQGEEANMLSEEVTALAAETQTEVETKKAEINAATNETQGIVTEMNAIQAGLGQDQTKMKTLSNQLKRESKKDSSGSQSSQGSQQPKQPQQPKPEPKTVRPDKSAKVEQPKKEEPEKENNPTTQEPANTPVVPVQTRAVSQPANASEPTVQDAPEGADKTEYASDQNKQPDFVGFVAQSDSLASGSVLVNTKAKATPAQNGNNNSGNSSNQGGIFALKNKQKQNAKKTSAARKEKTQTAANEAVQQPQIVAAKRSTPKAFDIDSMNGGGADKTKSIRTSMQALRTAAFNKQAKLSAMAIRANNNVMANIQKEAQAQAEAARQERLAREKQERIAKIKEYAGYVQAVGGAVSMAGTVTSAIGKNQAATGAFIVTTAQENMATTAAQIVAAEGKQVVGTTTITIGNATMTIGAAETTTGVATETAGVATTTAGVSTQAAGTTTISVSTPLLTFPTTPAGTAGVAAGTTTFVAGTATEAAGVATTTVGVTTQATGAATTAEGTATTTEGTTMTAEAAAELVAGNTEMAILEGTMAIGMEQEMAGIALSATGDLIQSIGAYTTAAGAAVSSGADIANGNILGGIASIVGAAASVVGISANLSTLGQAAVQVGAQGTALAGQLTTSGANQNNSNNNQDQKKKKKFKENERTQGIIEKTANKKMAVSNRFNK